MTSRPPRRRSARIQESLETNRLESHVKGNSSSGSSGDGEVTMGSAVSLRPRVSALVAAAPTPLTHSNTSLSIKDPLDEAVTSPDAKATELSDATLLPSPRRARARLEPDHLHHSSQLSLTNPPGPPEPRRLRSRRGGATDASTNFPVSTSTSPLSPAQPQRRSRRLQEQSSATVPGIAAAVSHLDGGLQEAPEDAALMPCVHTSRVPDLSRAREWLLDPSRWHCEVCQTTASALVCLHCPFVGCGDDDQDEGHMVQHAHDTGHWICVDVNEQAVLCTACRQVVPLDAVDASGARFPITRAFQRLLSELSEELQDPPQQQQQLPAVAEPGAKPRSASAMPTQLRKSRRQSSIFSRPAAEFERRDMLVTMLRRWQRLPLNKAFNAWRQYTQDTRTKQASSSAPTQPEPHARPLLDALDASGDDSLSTRCPSIQPSASTETALLPRVALRNLGNTCYLNAVIQALHATHLVRRFFLHPELLSRELERQSEERARSLQRSLAMHSEDDVYQLVQRRSDSSMVPPTEALSRELHNLFRVLKSRHSALLTPYSLLGSVWRHFPVFANHRQHDASEFLSLFLDRLSDELSGSSAKSTLKTHIFSGMVATNITCSRCRTTHQGGEEPFFDLGLDIPVVKHVLAGRRSGNTAKLGASNNVATLEGLLAHFCADDPVEYKCPACSRGDSTSGIRRQAIKHLPNVLVIQIKRFIWIPERRVGGKLATAVQFPISPEVLDMRPYIDASVLDTISDSTQYVLRAVVVHEGCRISSGHYYTFGWDSHGGTWVNYNDAKVTVVSKDKVESCEPYLLFYERIEPRGTTPNQLRASISFGVSSTGFVGETFEQAAETMPVRTKRKRQQDSVALPSPKRTK